MLMDRNPNAAILWVGATILGLQDSLLEEVRHGHIPTNHLSAEWSGKVQSFLQQPVSGPLIPGGSCGAVSLADQARLLHLAGAEGRSRAARCPWRPFGITPLEDTDVDVRLHAVCVDHGLQYRGFAWDCLRDRVPVSSGGGGNWNRYAGPNELLSTVMEACKNNPIDFSGMRLEDEALSARATRSIFAWLRGARGYAQGERGIWQHEWFQPWAMEAGAQSCVESSESDETRREKEESEPSSQGEDGASDQGVLFQ
jgi:hypothetical protein